ncbi:MAG: hypothetical protein WC481_00720 [Candidatus Omnitrophota bacterium]
MKRAAFLGLVCAFSLILVLPSIGNNIGDPNRIVYFNADEGGLMDEIWSYYSGQRRPSFQWDEDYGLEMLYIADAARIISPPPDGFTPGAFVLLIRWLHLAAWLSALAYLWYFTGRHFGRGWWQYAVVVLLAVRPAFAYFTGNLKPEPLVLLLMIGGLDFTLRILDNPSRKYVLTAIALGSIAFIVKFSGLFLIPVITWVLYICRKEKAIFTRFKYAWIYPSVVGAAAVLFAVILLCGYVRKSTGMTWCDEYGLWGGIVQSRIGIIAVLIGALSLFLSAVFKVMKIGDDINSSAMIVTAYFVLFVMVFGFRWLVDPSHLILSYAPLGAVSTGSPFAAAIAQKGLIAALFDNFAYKVRILDPIIFWLFVMYMVLELISLRNGGWYTDKQSKKRIALLVFCLPALLLMVSMLKFEKHHMVPFFVVMSILSMKGISMAWSYAVKAKWLKPALAAVFTILLAYDVYGNAEVTVRDCLVRSKQQYDVSYEVDKWLEENIDEDAVIAAGHYIHVYIPPRYKNVKVFEGYGKDSVKELRNIVKVYKPSAIYYNAGPSGAEPLPSVGEMLPEVKVRLLKEFDGSGRMYQRKQGDRFLIYEIVR